jgi:hypothetical protein
MFIRTKVSKRKTYWQVVENRRKGERIVQKVVVSLGRCETIADAIAANDIAIREEMKKLVDQFGSLVPTDLNDDHAVGTTLSALRKTKAKAFERRVNAIRRLHHKAAVLKDVDGKLVPPPIFDGQGYLTADGRGRLERLLNSKGITTGDLMREIGESPLNASVGNALGSGVSRVRKPSLIEKVELWVIDQEAARRGSGT